MGVQELQEGVPDGARKAAFNEMYWSEMPMPGMQTRSARPLNSFGVRFV